MKRIALVIGSGKSGSPHLPGATADVRQYTRFLQSAHGGGWYAHEIVALHDPSPEVFREAIEATEGSDYSLLVFAGHGTFAETADRSTALLRDGFEVPLEELRTRADRQLRIIDACRSLVWVPRPAAPSKAGNFLKRPARVLDAPETEAPDYEASCRRRYDAAIAAAAPGAEAVMFSCRVGEVSGDTPLGGTFSSALLEYAGRWWRGTYRRYADRVLWPREACEHAAAMIVGFKPPQHPWFESDAAGRRLPFAIR